MSASSARPSTHRLPVALDGPEIVGFTYAEPGADPFSREPHRIHVAPSRTGIGAGKALMGATLDGFRSGGAERALLRVAEGNGSTISFNERGGRRPTGTVREQPLGAAPTRQRRYVIDLRQR